MKRLALLTAMVASLVCGAAASGNSVLGLRAGTATVQAYSSSNHYIAYRGGEVARFSVVGDGFTTLNARLYDQSGRLVNFTTGPGDRILLTWVPSSTQTYRIEIINEGSTFNNYGWATN